MCDSVGDSTSTVTSLSLRQRFNKLLKRDSTLSSNVFNVSDVMSVPTTPGGTYVSSPGDDDDAARAALMAFGDGQSSHVQRSVSARRPRPRPHATDATSDLIEMDSFRYELIIDQNMYETVLVQLLLKNSWSTSKYLSEKVT